MQPNDREEYVNNNVSLEVHKFHNPLRNVYWVGAGIAQIQLNEEDFEDLLELLSEYDIETRLPESNKRYTFSLAGIMLAGAILLMFIMTVFILARMMLRG